MGSDLVDFIAITADAESDEIEGTWLARGRPPLREPRFQHEAQNEQSALQERAYF
jgi:hypothetical protein